MAKKQPGAKIGRPSSFNSETAERICALMAEGLSLRKVCEENPGLADGTSVRRWLSSAGPEFDAFRLQYARACEHRSELFAEEIVDIADTEPDPQRARVRIDARKWVAAKLLPKKYGEAVTVKGDKDNPLQIRKAPELSDDELAALAAGGLRGVD